MDLFTSDVQLAAVGIFVITAGLRKVIPWLNTTAPGRRLIILIPAVLGLAASFGGGINAAVGAPPAVKVSWGLVVAFYSTYAHKFLKQTIAGDDNVIITRQAMARGDLVEDLELPPDSPRRGSVKIAALIVLAIFLVAVGFLVLMAVGR